MAKNTEQKEKLIRFYKGTEGEETAVKLVDLAEQVQRNQKFRFSGFLDPFGQGFDHICSFWGQAQNGFGGRPSRSTPSVRTNGLHFFASI